MKEPSLTPHTGDSTTHPNRSAWSAWLQQIRPDSPTGDDPSYHDDFIALREEVAKLTVDGGVIVVTAELLIKNVAKDLRAAAYYAYGRLRCDGAEGFADGLDLIFLLLDRFGDALHPLREERRKTTLEWLSGSTVISQIDAMPDPSTALAGRIRETITALATFTSHWPESARPDLSKLLRHFEHASRTRLTSNTYGNTRHPAITPANDALPIESSRDLFDRARHMAAHLRGRPHGYLAAWRLLRCIRWDTLQEVPPHAASGRTRLPAPRAELRSHIKRLVLQKQWRELLVRIEAAFLEGANHLWLDLQYYAFIAQEQAGDEYRAAREPTAVDCGVLLKRLPGLEHLLFEDGSPFAESATLEWIARRVSVQATSQDRRSGSAPVDSGHDWRKIETQAVEMATEQGIDNAFAWLRDLTKGTDERQRFMREFTMARVAMRVDHADVATHLLSALDDLVNRHQLSVWEPNLAFDVKQHLMRTLKLRMTRKDADKPLIARRIDALLGQLTAIDPTRAVTLK